MQQLEVTLSTRLPPTQEGMPKTTTRDTNVCSRSSSEVLTLKHEPPTSSAREGGFLGQFGGGAHLSLLESQHVLRKYEKSCSEDC